VNVRLSARSRLTLLYTALFAVGGAALIAVTYLLVAHSLPDTPTTKAPDRQSIQNCLQAALSGGVRAVEAKRTCVALYTHGVQAGASAEGATTLSHLLTYSLVGLAGLTLLALGAGWILAGRILRPVHRITAAARAASEHNLSQRLSLAGPRNELRDLADTFDAMLERLDTAFTGQRRFIANASHELRTPLTVMRTAIDVVLAKPDPTPNELTSMAIEVRSAVDHAERLIEALLVLARNEHTEIPTEIADLATITEDALEGRVVVDLTITTNLSEAPLSGDPVLLELLAVNLIDNAERHNIPRGRITISTGIELASAVLRIVNTGQPVPPEEVNRLFQPFTRLDDRTNHRGFGLGLALVSSIVAIHGGGIDAIALPTGGLDIRVHFPLHPGPDSPRASG
jgi:signal transduction histidine kinase